MASRNKPVGVEESYIEGDKLVLDIDTNLDLTGAQSIRWAMYPWPDVDLASPTTKYGQPDTVAALTKELGAGISVLAPTTDGVIRVTLASGDTLGVPGAHGYEVKCVLSDGSRSTPVAAVENLLIVTPQRLV